MPQATVTVRELKNKDMGLDLSVPTHKVIPGLIRSTVEYHVVVVSELHFFKSPKHRETDVVQYMKPKPKPKPDIATKPALTTKPAIATKPAVATKPAIASKPSVAKNTKPVLPAKPKPGADSKPQLSASKEEDLFSAPDVSSDMGTDDIMKYIESQASQSEADLDLFS
ncbi:HCLS1-binding protein 3 [Lingula anatina]|uniref:HCLS1-binding protein 3 n=1 Tax=Lingula anatina TaxID=7574 RepID=A0A1S3HYF8_LINAN|nr:HCLS1-binding protein 3 [Lingula anatina]|eukprot:XP_013391060.1 HCLS1-binding protein 3 [Lingula anatina]